MQAIYEDEVAEGSSPHTKATSEDDRLQKTIAVSQPKDFFCMVVTMCYTPCCTRPSLPAGAMAQSTPLEKVLSAPFSQTEDLPPPIPGSHKLPPLPHKIARFS
eukprot:6458136-Amphidinium_carterae.1